MQEEQNTANQNRKNSKLLLFSSLVLVMITLLMIFVAYPRDHGGYPAVIIGIIGLWLFVKSILSLRKAKPAKQDAPTTLVAPVDLRTQNYFISSNIPQPKVSLTRSITGILIASLAGYAAYIIVGNASGLGAIATAPAAAVIVGFIALWRINKDTILQATTTSLLTLWFMNNLIPLNLHDQFITRILIALFVTAAYAFHRFILGLIGKRYGLVFIVVAVILGLGYMYLGMGLRFREGSIEQKQNLQELDFQFYKPTYVPAGYTLAEPYASVSSFVDQAYVHTNLDKIGGGAIFVNQFKTLSYYKPPVNCGSNSPVIVNPDGPPTPCKEIARSKVGCTVYREITHRPVGFSGTEEKIILSKAYCNFKGTTIVIGAYDYELSNEEVVKIFDSMTVAGGQPSSSTTQPQQETSEIKEFITVSPVKIGQVKRVSKFRSCVQPYQSGLNTSSEAETNRSLSHYFGLDGEFPKVIVDVFAPFDSVIESVEFGRDYDGVRVLLASSNSPWRLEIRMSNPDQDRADLKVGSVFKAGAYIGYAKESDGLGLTLAKEENGTKQYDSIFAHLNKSTLDEYTKKGFTLNNVIIPKLERDGHPCPSSNIPDWIELKL